MIQPLNFCRQMVRQFSQAIAEKQGLEWYREQMVHAVDLAAWSTKYMLPKGGVMLDDPELRALSSIERIRLPQKYVALEYARAHSKIHPWETHSSKSIVFAREADQYVIVTPVIWFDYRQSWALMQPCGIPTSNFLLDEFSKTGHARFKVQFLEPLRMPICMTDYQDELAVLMHFLNALSCSNVKAERCERQKKKVKAALPFDEYHVLTIDSAEPSSALSVGRNRDSRSPREHLRRGHIRRLADNRRIWVNATVVNHGVGGKISKDYLINR